MLHASLVFFLVGVAALVLGITGTFERAGLSFESGRLIFFAFLGLSVIAFALRLSPRRRSLRRVGLDWK